MKTMFGNPAARVNADYALELEYEEAKKKLTDELAALESTPAISEREALINQYLKTIAEQAEIKTQGCK